MPVATTQLVTSSFIVIIPGSAPQLVGVFLLKGGRADITHHSVPLWHNACTLDTLKMWGGAVVVGVVNAEAPPTVLPQGTIPFGVVGLFIVTLETVRERGTLSLPFEFVFGYGAQLETVFSFNIAPLVLRRPLCCMDTWEKG